MIATDNAMCVYFGTIGVLPMQHASSFHFPTGFGTLGFTVPVAVGSALAAPDRQIIGITGDGGLLFTATELAVAAAEHLSMAIVVFDNSGYGEIRAEMLERDEKPLAVDAPPRDLVLLAQALGARGVRVETPDALIAELRAARDPSGADGARHQRTAPTGRITTLSTHDSYLELTWTDEVTGIKGYVVIDTLSRGVAGGGLRMRDGVTLDEVRDLAQAMTLKEAVVYTPGDRYIPLGGAKGGIDCDPYDPRARDVLGTVRSRDEAADRGALRHR